MRTEGFCSAPLRSRDIRDKVRNRILALFSDQFYFSATKQRRTKSCGTHVHNTSNNTSTKLQLQQIKLHIEIKIVNSKPVTPTTILLPPRSSTTCDGASRGADLARGARLIQWAPHVDQGRFQAIPRPACDDRRSIVVGVTGFKLTISMCSLIR